MFVDQLMTISLELSHSEFVMMKFLCRDKLNSSVPSQQLLKQANIFREQNKDFLFELLFHCGRYDLLAKFNVHYLTVYDSIRSNGSLIPSYR